MISPFCSFLSRFISPMRYIPLILTISPGESSLAGWFVQNIVVVVWGSSESTTSTDSNSSSFHLFIHWEMWLRLSVVYRTVCGGWCSNTCTHTMSRISIHKHSHHHTCAIHSSVGSSSVSKSLRLRRLYGSVCVVSLGGIISRTQQNTANVRYHVHLICIRGSYQKCYAVVCVASSVVSSRSTPALPNKFSPSNRSTRPVHLCAFIISTTVTLYHTHPHTHTQIPRSHTHTHARSARMMCDCVLSRITRE